MLYSNGHRTEKISDNEPRAVIKSNEPLLRERWYLTGQDQGFVDSHGVLRLKIPMARRDGEQRESGDRGQEDAMLPMDILTQGKFRSVLICTNDDQLGNALDGTGRADIR